MHNLITNDKHVRFIIGYSMRYDFKNFPWVELPNFLNMLSPRGGASHHRLEGEILGAMP